MGEPLEEGVKQWWLLPAVGEQSDYISGVGVVTVNQHFVLLYMGQTISLFIQMFLAFLLPLPSTFLLGLTYKYILMGFSDGKQPRCNFTNNKYRSSDAVLGGGESSHVPLTSGVGGNSTKQGKI